ncbi:MAG TPA: molybdopterin cofactor-binding domain-containing protein, partial [Acidimicrobiales bacterium]|nr:molybdopterin cofactor-binding domain-containing protein [Acidimicrobiales bacterium]
MGEAGSILGNAVVRLEDPTLLTGAGKYVDDLDSTGAAHVVFVRSSVAHGTLRSVDVEDAKSMPGVLAVYDARGDDLGMTPFQSFPMMAEVFNRPIFARDRVRFVGDIVAAVVAETGAQAVDAAEAVVIDVDPLPAVVTQAVALAPDAELLFPESETNVCFGTSFGEDADPLEGAEVVAEVDMVSQRLAGVPMEPNGCLMVPGEPAGGITCWISHQAPHSVQPALSAVLGLEPEKVRVVCPWVGGGFGPKAAVYVEYLAAAAAAIRLGRPVKWTETRSEDMVSLVHGRDYTMNGKLGLTKDGKITGLDVSVKASGGAYPAIGAVLPMLTQMMAVGVYKVPRVRFQGTTVVTNTTPVGAYRGAGRPEATQLI